jgi:ribonuclease BN (tRNA processing enzyme)
MRITILGSGTCVPKKDSASPGYFIDSGDLKILMDCGSGTLRQMAQANLDFKDIDLVLLSNFNIDHTLDLATLFMSLTSVPNFKREKDLYIIGPKGLDDFLKKFNDLYKFGSLISGYEVRTVELDKEINILNKIKIDAILATNFKNSISLKITKGDKSFVYSGDTGKNEALVDFAKGSKLVIMDCAYPNEDTKSHISLPSAIDLGKKINPKGLVLTHFFHDRDKYNLKKYEKDFPGKIIMAQDLMKLEI